MINSRHGLDLTEGKISLLLMRFAAPFVAANLISTLYGVVGMLVVGRYTDSAVISGVATGAQVMNIMISFITGIGTGVTVIIGRCIGEKNDEAGTRAAGSTLIVSAVFIAVLTLVILFGREPLLDLMKTPQEARPAATRYVVLCTIGVPFNIAFGMLSSIFRGMGNSSAPSLVAGITCVFNIVLSIVLVAGCGLAEAGVAIATSAAQILSFILIAALLYRKKLPFKFNVKDIKADRHSTHYILMVGLPIVLQELLITVSFMIITNRVNAISVGASAAVGVVARAFNIAFVIPAGIGSAVSAMTAQNLGADKSERAVLSLRWGIIYSLVLEGLIFAACQLWPESITGLFANDAEVVTGAASYLRSFSIDGLLVAIVFCVNAYFGGCGKSKIAMIFSLASTFLVRVPLSILFSGIEGIEVFDKLLYLGFAAPLASLSSLLMFIVYVLRRRGKRGVPEMPEVR